MIRAARQDDLPAITRLRTSVHENHLSIEQMAERGITEASTAAALAAGTLLGWVVEEGKVIVAFAMAEPTQQKLFALFTQPGHEGLGYGTALLEIAEIALKDRGCGQVTLDTGTGTAAIAFYQRRGYKITEQRDGDTFMHKSLA